MRKDWPETYGGDLAEMLQVGGFSGSKDGFLSLVVTIAQRVFRPGVGDGLMPDPQGRSFQQIRSRIVERVLALKTMAGDPPAFSEGFNRLNINGRTKKSLLEKMVLPLENYLRDFDGHSFSLVALSRL